MVSDLNWCISIFILLRYDITSIYNLSNHFWKEVSRTAVVTETPLLVIFLKSAELYPVISVLIVSKRFTLYKSIETKN